MEAKLYGQKAGGMNINGIIEDYYVYAGENISAGDLVEYINGIASSVNYGTSAFTLVGQIGSNNSTMSASLLNDGNVFVAYGGMDFFYGVVVTVEGANITPNTAVALSTTNNNAHSLSVVTLKNGNVFIVHSNYDKAPLYGLVCEINGTTITVVTETQIGTAAYGSWGTVTMTSSSVLLDNGDVFVAHNYGSGSYVQHLYGVIVTINGTTITAGTDTALDTAEDQGCKISAKKLNNGNVFIAHGSGTSGLYAMVCTVSGTTITAGTDTEIDSSTYTSKFISAEVVDDSRVFIAHSESNNYDYLYAIVCTVSGTTITKGSDTQLVRTKYAGYNLATLKIGTDKVLIAHGDSDYKKAAVIANISGTTITIGADIILGTVTGGNGDKLLILLPNGTIFYGANDSGSGKAYAQIFAIDEANNIITNNIEVTDYETQVRKVTTPQFNGVAKTNGTGGDETAHKEKVSIYTLVEAQEFAMADGNTLHDANGNLFTVKAAS